VKTGTGLSGTWGGLIPDMGSGMAKPRPPTAGATARGRRTCRPPRGAGAARTPASTPPTASTPASRTSSAPARTPGWGALQVAAGCQKLAGSCSVIGVHHVAVIQDDSSDVVVPMTQLCRSWDVLD
jgi:hypothetical protein